MAMSGVSGEGLTEVLRAVRASIRADKLRLKSDDKGAEPVAWRP